MSKLLQLLGLELPPAVKAAHAESADAFRRQLETRCVTEASQLNKVAVKDLNRALKVARAESESQTRAH